MSCLQFPARSLARLAATAAIIMGLSLTAAAAENLLLNSDFAFHPFESSRTGKPGEFRSNAIPCWNTEAYGDAEAWRAARVAAFRTTFATDGVVRIAPGKSLSQFALLSELGLDHGDHVSLSVRGFQKAATGLEASLHCMKIDNQTGTYSIPGDQRLFPRHSRGELVRGPGSQAIAKEPGHFRALIENFEIVGKFTESANTSNDEPNTIGLLIEFTNRASEDVWVYAPCLSKTATAQERLTAARSNPEIYRSIPRTMQKLWRGEPLHIIVMGSSIDRGSANPAMVLYDENPASPTFKEALTRKDFEGDKIGKPEWNDYIGWWQHHQMYGGRLRQLLMQRFGYPMNKLLLNTMAADGSCISEAHSGFLDYAELRLPPEASTNGHRTGKTWQELYPALFARPEGPRPDLIIFGSGANEHIDAEEEIAVFEGAIRWFQRRYPHIEFLFCMWQNRESYSPNPPHLAELSLRYQIPMINLGRTVSQTTRYCNSYALCPSDGHPQATGHFIWAKQLERAFDAPGPVLPGQGQLQLPERLLPQTATWEGDNRSYSTESPRIWNKRLAILDENTVNLWAKSTDETVSVIVDGVANDGSRRRAMPRRDLRNSTFALGRLSLGERHIVEVTGTQSELVAFDCKAPVSRAWHGAESPFWQEKATLNPASHQNDKSIQPFVSTTGSPFGKFKRTLAAGQSLEIDLPGTDFSIAFVDDAAGGSLLVAVDQTTAAKFATNTPFKLSTGEDVFVENRHAIRGLKFGLHRLKLTAENGPVSLLGVFRYDLRPSTVGERILRGYAAPGETVEFAAGFRARPLVSTTGGLQIESENITTERVTFSGNAAGAYQIVGE